MRIEINLLPGQKKRGGGGGGIALPDFQALIAQVKDPLLLGAVGAWIGAVAFVGLVFSYQSTQRALIAPRLDEVRAEARRYRFMIAEKERTTQLRDSLAGELRAIRDIDDDRYVWAHILEEVNRALPPFTWIVSLDAAATQDVVMADGTIVPGPVRFSIDGRTSDMQAYTRFVTQLQDSPWLDNVQAGATQSVIENERQVTSFTVQVTYQVADSSFIRVVPVDQIFGQGG